jgi:hypothetical protein
LTFGRRGVCQGHVRLNGDTEIKFEWSDAVAPAIHSILAGLAVATFGGYDQVLVSVVAASLAGAVLVSRAS